MSLFATLALALGAAPQAAPGDLSELEGRLRSEDARERRAAVIALSEVGTTEAWVLLMSALGEREAMVADEAQLRVGTCSDEAAVRRLLSSEGLSSGERRRRPRAAEAAGRLTVPVEPRELLAGLKVDNVEVQRMTLWSVERLARAGLLGTKARRQLRFQIESLRERARDPGLMAAAWAATAFAEPPPEEAGGARAVALEALEHEEAQVRACGVWLLGELGEAEAEELAWPRRRDRSSTVRAALDRLLFRIGRASAAQKLVTRLETEARPGLRYRILTHLQRLSDKRYGPDPRAWREWADELKRNWRPEPEPRRPPPPQTAAQLAGLPMTSDRFTILVDFSGSMWEPVDGGGTRKDRAAAHLRDALARLDETTRFNLAPYAAQTAFWQDDLQEAGERSALRALSHFERCNLRGPGNLWEAFLEAVAEPEVDAVLLYTDGSPTGTSHWNLDLIALLLAERNRFRNVSIHAVLVEPNRILAGRWREICESSGGRMAVVQG